MTQFNRTVCLLAYMGLVGFLAYLEVEENFVLIVAGVVGTPLAAYIGIKGSGKKDD